MDKQVEVRFDKEAFEAYQSLIDAVRKGKISRTKPDYSHLLASVDFVLLRIKEDPFYGDLVPRRHVSKALFRKYGTHKVFRAELAGYWRLLYTVLGDEIKIIALILDFMDHLRYNKLFGYRKR